MEIKIIVEGSRERKVFIIDILYDFVIMKGHFDDDVILTPLSSESFNFLILFNISAYFVPLCHPLLGSFTFFIPFFCGIEFYLLSLTVQKHSQTHHQEILLHTHPHTHPFTSLSTLSALTLHGVLKIYDAKGDLTEKMKNLFMYPFPRYLISSLNNSFKSFFSRYFAVVTENLELL